MTPFGARLRDLRRQHDVTLKDLADHLGVSSAYLSALEHGRRGRPSWWLVQRVCGYFHVIWDDAEALADLARLSHPRIVIDTAGLNEKATLLANRLAQRIGRLEADELDRLLALLPDDKR